MGMVQRYVHIKYICFGFLSLYNVFSHVSFSLCVYVCLCALEECAFSLFCCILSSIHFLAGKPICFCHRCIEVNDTDGEKGVQRSRWWQRWQRRWLSDGSTTATTTTATSVFHIHIARISATYESASFLQFMVKKCKFNFLQCVVILISLPLSELPMPL